MKGIFIILPLVLFCGCSTLKRSASNQETLTESISQLKETAETVSIVDSVVNGNKDLSIKTTSDSHYIRKTIIREYYSDEFDFGTMDSIIPKQQSDKYVQTGINSAHEAHPGSTGPGRLLYKETEIQEKGGISRMGEKNEIAENGSSLFKETISLSNKNDSISLKKSEQRSNKSTERIISIPWWIWLSAGLVALYSILKFTNKL